MGNRMQNQNSRWTLSPERFVFGVCASLINACMDLHNFLDYQQRHSGYS